VLYAKLPSTEEAVNDLNPEMANFWEVLKRDFDALSTEVKMNNIPSTANYGRKTEKTEVLTANYPIYDKSLSPALFD
jgi:site-specific DNA-adenine methylase